jgi:hypothetical protein
MLDSTARAERIDLPSSEAPFYTWEVAQKPVAVRCRWRLSTAWSPRRWRTFRSLSSRGSEIGGLLLGPPHRAVRRWSRRRTSSWFRATTAAVRCTGFPTRPGTLRTGHGKARQAAAVRASSATSAATRARAVAGRRGPRVLRAALSGTAPNRAADPAVRHQGEHGGNLHSRERKAGRGDQLSRVSVPLFGTGGNAERR